MRPGTTVRPRRLISRVQGLNRWPLRGPTAVNLPSWIVTSLTVDPRASIVTNLPLVASYAQLEKIDVSPPVFPEAGRAEQTLLWQEDNGIMCRALVDWLHDDHSTIDDLKTTKGSATPSAWIRNQLYTIGADVQVAFHSRGVEKLTGVKPQMRYIVQETSPPYALSVISLGPAALVSAQAKVEHAIKRWGQCLKSGKWPGYAPFVHYADLPAWEEMRTLELEEAV